MAGSSVLISPDDLATQVPRVPAVPSAPEGPRVDPLSEVLALLKPRSYSSGGFGVRGDFAVHFPKHDGIKCYAILTGRGWLVLEGGYAPVELNAGDCFLLPRGIPFQMTTDLSLQPVHYTVILDRLRASGQFSPSPDDRCYMAGGHFALSGGPARMLLDSLPPVIHIRRKTDREAMRWSLERMREELRDPRPGGSLIAQQLAYMMLVQALRLHLADAGKDGPGWLPALADRHMSLAIAAMHGAPGHPWTLQTLAERVGLSRSVFALRFRNIVGATPMEYLTRWRMMLAADRLQTTGDGIAEIAHSLGYDSESAFGKAFRRTMGCSPRQYTRTAPSVVAPTNPVQVDSGLAATA